MELITGLFQCMSYRSTQGKFFVEEMFIDEFQLHGESMTYMTIFSSSEKSKRTVRIEEREVASVKDK